MGLFNKNTKTVIGEVIAHHPTTFLERQIIPRKVYNIGPPFLTFLFVPTISYAVDGTPYCIKSKTAYSGSGYEKYLAIGRKVEVLYEEAHPEKFRIKIIKE